MKKKPKIFGHRGAGGNCPENTIAAFVEAADSGAEGIELDVHLSRDGKLVVCHDETLERTTNGTGLIKEREWDYIRRLDAGTWFSPVFTGERVPLLDDVFRICKRRNLQVNVELKTDYFSYDGIEKMAAASIARFGMDEMVIVSSFNHYSIIRLKKTAPHLAAGLLYSCHIYRPHIYAASLPAEALHPAYHLTNPEIINDAHAAGYQVNVWFAREKWDETQALRVLESGADCIITNYPRDYLALV